MSQTIDFLAPRLVGERFQGHAIPLEILKDLAVIEEMVVEVAKWKYLQEHSDRKRTPRGFTDGISIKMTAIGDGSAIPKIVLAIANLSLFPPENQQYFEKARESIINCIDAAEFAENNITQFLPSPFLAYFDRMGRGLREDEVIEFNPANKARPARLNKVTRHKLLEMSLVKDWTEEVIERGLIPEVDQEKKRFTLQLINGIKVQVPLEQQHKETVFKAFMGFDSNIKIIVHGIGRFNKTSKLESLDSVEHVEILDTLDIPARLEELALLKDGWLDGKGSAPDKNGLVWLSKSFDNNFKPDLPLPHLYPTPEGGVQAEWSIGAWEISLEIDMSNHTAEYQAVNVSTGVTDEKNLDLNKADDWLDFNASIEAVQKELS